MGKGFGCSCKKGDALSVGEMRPLKEGQPVSGDIVSLKPREDHPALFDVHTEYAAEPQLPAGPTRVSTDRYRHGWESLWGRRPTSAEYETQLMSGCFEHRCGGLRWPPHRVAIRGWRARRWRASLTAPCRGAKRNVSYRRVALQYACDVTKLPPSLRHAFVGLEADASTRAMGG